MLQLHSYYLVTVLKIQVTCLLVLGPHIFANGPFWYIMHILGQVGSLRKRLATDQRSTLARTSG